MGWPVTRFPTTPDVNLYCGVCAGVLQEAVLTPCGHSFCQGCVDTWLRRPMTDTCPQCRTKIAKKNIAPIYAVRQLVGDLSVYCEFKGRGCTLTTRVEDSEKHTQFCGYAPIKCDKCSETVNRMGLRRHKDICSKTGSKHSNKRDAENDVRHFEKRITNLEIQLKHAKKKLELCEADNRKLRRELSMAKADFQRTAPGVSARPIKVSWRQCHGIRLDPDYSYGHTPESIANLSLLISSSLHRKPSAVDSGRIFACIKRCFEMYARCGTSSEHDVYMLIATANASNWFSEEQRVSFHCWLQSISRYQKFASSSRSATYNRRSQNN